MICSVLSIDMELPVRFIQNIGRLVCHRLPERSFLIAGLQLPVCARCTGIFAGVFVAGLILLLFRRGGNKPFGIATVVLLCLGFCAVGFDGVSSYLGIRETNNLIRVITGIMLGVSLPPLYVLLKNYKTDGENAVTIIKRPIEVILSWGITAAFISISALMGGSFFTWLLLSLVIDCAIVTIYCAIPYFLWAKFKKIGLN